MKKVAVIILNWNGKALLEQFLPSVLNHSMMDDCEIVLADNGSSDDSLNFVKQNFPQISRLALDKNYGFAEGYNKAIRMTNAEYVVLLNSDVETTPDWLTTLISFMDTHAEVAAVQPKIRAWREKDKFEYAGAGGGFLDALGYPFCRGRILDEVEVDCGQYEQPIPVFWATGACLCIRRNDYMEAGGLDADFFAHMEEVDLCWRLNARGRKVMCVPQSLVYHVGAASLQKENPRKTYLNFRNNWLMLYKNLPRRRLILILAFRYLLDGMAMVHLIVAGKFANAKAVFRAHVDFLKMLPNFKKKRKENQAKSSVQNISTQYSGSILWNYYFRGRRKYSDLFKVKG